VELEAQGKRLVLDVGQPLDLPDPTQIPLPPVRGFARADPSLLGVILSHPHQDHYGLAMRLPKSTRFFMGAAAERILHAAAAFLPTSVRLDNVQHLEDRTPITLPPFTITPYLMDHSAYDAYALLVEADGARLFYTGDLRAHGRKGALFHKLVRSPPPDVSVLLMEGTTLGRSPQEKGLTETELEARFVDLFRTTSGMPLVWCSGQNIDRIVTVFRACKKAGRQLILDMYTAHVLRATGNTSIPQAGWRQIRVFLPETQKRRIRRTHAFALAQSYRPWRIFPEALADAAPTSALLFRPSMTGDLEAAGCLKGARLIYSLWSGYLRDATTQPFLAWLRQHDIPLAECHTSGHAPLGDLVTFRQAFRRATVVPIHTDRPERFAEVFGNVQQRADGEWWEVERLRDEGRTSDDSGGE
jgi:ribonuclease J